MCSFSNWSVWFKVPIRHWLQWYLMNRVWFALIVYWINRIVEECFCYGNLKSWWVVQGTDGNTTFTLQDDFWFWLVETFASWWWSSHFLLLFVKICTNNFIGTYDYIVIFRFSTTSSNETIFFGITQFGLEIFTSMP